MGHMFLAFFWGGGHHFLGGLLKFTLEVNHHFFNWWFLLDDDKPLPIMIENGGQGLPGFMHYQGISPSSHHVLPPFPTGISQTTFTASRCHQKGTNPKNATNYKENVSKNSFPYKNQHQLGSPQVEWGPI